MKRASRTEESESRSQSASELITQRIRDLNDWRGQTLATIRSLIKAADPDIVEEWKWRGTPVWSHDGIVCTGETYRSAVKMTFARGASLADPAGLFNSSLDGNVRRAIDVHEGETLDRAALSALIQSAVALNTAIKRPKTAAKLQTPTAKAKPTAKATPTAKAKPTAKPRPA